MATSESSALFNSSIAEAIRDKLLFSFELADIIFVMGNGGEEIPAHKLLLSIRSPFFKNKFYDNLGDLKSGVDTMEVLDCDPKVFKSLIEFIYCDEVNIDTDIAEEMFLAAIKYRVVALISLFQEKIDLKSLFKNHLSVYNCFDLLVATKQLHDKELRKNCYEFIAEHCEELLDNDTFLELTWKDFTCIFKLETVTAPEIEIFKLLDKWVQKNVSSRQRDDFLGNEACDIKNMVRLQFCSADDIKKIIRPTHLIPVHKLSDLVLIKNHACY